MLQVSHIFQDGAIAMFLGSESGLELKEELMSGYSQGIDALHHQMEKSNVIASVCIKKVGLR